MLKSDGTTQNYLYLHRDYQGSILAITNSIGQVVEKRLFDAWGAIAKVEDRAGNALNGLTILDRGYTGHEHLQSVGIIHMNGRLYDPKLHRFLQPDNFVQDPFNTQNYNRYGYVLNNPLKYTDPTGEFKINWNDVLAAVAIVVGVVLTVVSSGTLVSVGYGLIGAGVAHFGATYAEYSRTGDWNSASNNAGFSFSTTIDTDWGYNNKDKTNGVTQTVVKPKSEVDGGGGGSTTGENGNNIVNSIQNIYDSNHKNLRTHFNTAEIVGGTAEIYGFLAAPFTEGTSLTYAAYGAKMSAYGTVGNAVMDVFDGHYGDAANRWTQFTLSAGMGRAIEKGVPYNTFKNLLNAFKTYSETYILPIFQDNWGKFNSPQKLKH